MRFHRLAAACAVALLSALAPANAEEVQQTPPAEGQTAAPAAVPAEETKAAEDPNEVICKKMEAETGTRLGKRKECHTRKEWDEIAEESRREMEKAQNKN